MKTFKMPQSEVLRFLLVGSTTVLIDFFIYFLLLYVMGLETNISKGVGFSSGTLFSYFANKKVTFKSQLKGTYVFVLFLILYIVTLTINVSVNELGLLVFGKTEIGFILSLFISTGFSAVLNFIGMKYLVFKG